jgi:hypothetical protein
MYRWYNSTLLYSILATGNSHCRLRRLVNMRTPELRRAIGLIDRLAIVIDRRVFTRCWRNSVFNLYIKVRLTIHHARRLTPTVGHGKVTDLDIANDTTIGGSDTGNEHTANPHEIERSGTAPANIHDQTIVVNFAVAILCLIHLIGTVTNDEYREPCEQDTHNNTELPRTRAWSHGLVSRRINVLHGLPRVRVAVILFVTGIGHFCFKVRTDRVMHGVIR